MSCRGVIDDAARMRIGLEFGPEDWNGGALQPGQPFPSVPQRFHFNVSAESAEDAVERVREIVAAAGGQADRFEAAPITLER